MPNVSVESTLPLFLLIELLWVKQLKDGILFYKITYFLQEVLENYSEYEKGFSGTFCNYFHQVPYLYEYRFNI